MSSGNVPGDRNVTLPTGFWNRHPIGFWFFFWGEFAERASYYGMRAILTLYMVDKLGFSKADAGTVMSLFIAGTYFMPLVGGFIADNFFGKYWTIVGFSLPYILGHVILGYEDKLFLYIAMVLLATGSGVIKPNISTLMGMTYDQQRPGQDQIRSEAFAMFYGAINIGAALSQISMPYLRTRYSYFIAFLFPAALMVVAFAIFAAGKPFYAPEVIRRTRKTPEEKSLQWAVLRQLFGLFFLVMFFWAIFDQSASTWIFFANDYLNLELFGVHVDPDQIQAINPILIVAFLPGVTIFWAWLIRRGIKVRATDKMMVGFLLTALTMAIHAVAAHLAISSGQKVSLWWQAIAFVVITVAEILISVTGLELAYTAAPKNMKSFVTACWLLTVSLANLFINVPLSKLYPDEKNPSPYQVKSPTDYFVALTIMMLVVAAAFFFVAKRFNRIAAQAQTIVPDPIDDVAAPFDPTLPKSQRITDRDRLQE